MQILIFINLIGWIPFCLVLFAMLPRLPATLISVVGAWLFLPPAGLSFRGIPDYTKVSAFGYGIMLSIMIFAPERLARFRPSWLDLPIFGLFVAPMFTSLSNDLGAYDGLSGMNTNLTSWCIPYLVGRLSLDNPRDIRTLAIAIVAGGVAYIPLCLLEMVAGPIINSKIYGMELLSDERFGGSRPRVFLQRGLELGIWMSVCSLLGLWLWRSGALRRFLGLSFGLVALPALLITTLLTRSSGAIALLAMALMVLWLSVWTQRRVWMVVWLSVTFIYAAVRISDLWDYSGLISFLSHTFDPERAQSLEFRFQNEDLLINRSMRRPVFGWGGFGRASLNEETGKGIVTDGLWIILLSGNGLVGLLSFVGAFVAPAYAFVRKYPARRWIEPDVGAMAAVAAMIGLYLFDCVLNAFPNAVYMVAAGGLASAMRAPAAFDLLGSGDLRTAARQSEGHAAVEDRGEDRVAVRYIEMARSLRLAGDFGGAAAARRHALTLMTRNSLEAHEPPAARRRRLDCGNDLSWLLATRPDPATGDREEAVGLARAIIEAEPESPTYWNTLALALCRNGDFDQAQEAARRSMELDASWNGYDMIVLALADARLDRKDEAGIWLGEAVRWRDENAPSDPTLGELIRETEAALVS